jgi:hypothetical protein
MAMRRLMAIDLSCDRIYRSAGARRRFGDDSHLFAIILRRNARASPPRKRTGGAQWHRDLSKRRSDPTVKNGKEAYLECVTRCARGLRCRKSGGADAADLRNCALCASGTPPRSGRRRRIWANIMQRRQGHGNANH